jgi:eukaryotic translation initiation factor 2C
MSSPSTLQDFQDIVNETDRRRTPSTPTAINEPTNVQNIKSVMAGLKTCFIGPRDQSGDRTKVPSSQKDRKIGPFEIISNYVEVKKLPGILYQYSLTFQRGPTTDPIVLNRRCEIIAAFDAMIAADALKLNQRVWATDYKDLWCDTPLDPLVLGASQQFEFTQLNGRVAGDLMVNAKYQKSQDSTPQIIEQSNIGDLTELTRAMNAHVTKGVRESNQNPDDEIIQVGANKFFLKGGYQQLVRGLVAVRGYYTSIRPTTSGFLLNVNTATSAFLEPIRVSTLLSYFGNDTKYVEKMLKGKTVRIIYERENYDEDKSKVDPNGDLARTKVFQNFGLSATKQQFFNILRDENDPNKKTVDPEDEGTFVSEFFETGITLSPGTSLGSGRCSYVLIYL